MSTTSRRRIQIKEVLPVDCFEKLPDSALCRILSFLPTTREVVANSLLSKRWKYLWRNVANLNFENHLHGSKKEQFTLFVYRVMMLHEPSIKNMRLSSTTSLDEEVLRTWIGLAATWGLECLDLDLIHLKFRWPWSLFRCKTLVDLKLHVDFSNLRTPTAPFFPSLQKLHIQPASSSLYDPESLKKFIVGCSALENLFMRIHSSGPCSISSPTLKKLEIYYRHSGDDSGSKISLAVPALEFLKVKCLRSEFFVEDQLNSLVEVDICFSRIRVSNEDVCRDSFERFVKLISSVKVLRLRCCFKQPLTLPMNTQFRNLTKLNISSNFFEWSLVRSLMQSSTNLEFITLEQNDWTFHGKARRELWNDPEDVPNCLLCSLRKLSITGYGIKDELDMVTYVLENAKVLESVDIGCFGHKDNSDLLNKIAMIKRASNCQLSFV